MDADKKALSGNSRHTRPENPVTGCPLTAALAAIGGKWKMIIIYWLAESPKHFAGLGREMSSISQKVLTRQLREPESDEIIVRKPTGPFGRLLNNHLQTTEDRFYRLLMEHVSGAEGTWRFGRSR